MGNSVTLQICRSASKYTKKRLYFISFKSSKSRKITNIENKTLKSKLLFAVTFWVVVEVQLLYNVVLVSGVQFLKVFWNLFVFGRTRASLLPMGFLQLQQVGMLSSCGVTDFSLRGLLLLQSTSFRARGPRQCMGLFAPWRVGSSQTRDRTCGPCVGRRTLNHWTTGEVFWYTILVIQDFLQVVFHFRLL